MKKYSNGYASFLDRIGQKDERITTVIFHLPTPARYGPGILFPVNLIHQYQLKATIDILRIMNIHLVD